MKEEEEKEEKKKKKKKEDQQVLHSKRELNRRRVEINTSAATEGPAGPRAS